ncbi:DUF1289 domain-containing protein [bacterium]|nr:DUF1289 domain-containing protein [bacterium]
MQEAVSSNKECVLADACLGCGRTFAEWFNFRRM